MKLKILFLLVFFILSNSLAYSQDTINKSEYIRNGEFVFYKDSLYTGIALEKTENGKVISEEKYKNGVANGIWKEWFKSGEKKFEGNFTNGKGNGTWTQWHEDGSIQRKITFNNGKVIEE
ncbi:MAG: hypothetical protein WCK02_08540 [Bacteroidota bacterium]